MVGKGGGHDAFSFPAAADGGDEEAASAAAELDKVTGKLKAPPKTKDALVKILKVGTLGHGTPKCPLLPAMWWHWGTQLGPTRVSSAWGQAA